MKPIQFSLLSLIIMFANACGQPGPLYLPKNEPPAQQVPPDNKTEQSQELEAPPENDEPESKTLMDPNQ